MGTQEKFTISVPNRESAAQRLNANFISAYASELARSAEMCVIGSALIDENALAL